MIKLFNNFYESMNFIDYKKDCISSYLDEKGKNMAETLKFVYVLILFLSIFLIMIVYDSKTFYFSHHCQTDKDCPKNPPLNIRCRKGFCVQI